MPHSHVVPYCDPTEHQTLAPLLPLATPLSLLIDPSNVCNFRCTFCPTAHPALLASVARPKGLMAYDLFCKIIDGLEAFPQKIQRIHLYKDGEPLLNRRLPEMIAYAKARGVADSIETTTNAALLSREMIDSLLDSGLDRIRISVEHVSKEGYRAVTGTYDEYAKIIANVSSLFTQRDKRGSHLRIHAKIVDVGLSDVEKARFHEDFGGIADEVHVDALMGWSDSSRHDFTLGQSPTTGMTRRTRLDPQRLVCAQPFYTLAVNFNGLVSVCCVDWTMSTIVGNCRTHTLKAIWNGPELAGFRMMHLMGDRGSHRACGDCQYLLGMSEASNLDHARLSLRERFSQHL